MNKSKWWIWGNEKILNFLEKILNNQSAQGVYIFNGYDYLGKLNTAFYFAKSYLCLNKNIESDFLFCDQCSSCNSFFEKNGIFHYSHPDLHIVEKQEAKKNISIKQILRFIQDFSLSPVLGSRKLGIIKNADFLSKEASNALLKTLEELGRDRVIILISSDFSLLLPTIVSRSQLVNFVPISQKDLEENIIKNYNLNKKQASIITSLSMGRPALAKKMIEDKDFLTKCEKESKLFFDLLNLSLEQRILKIETIFNKKEDLSLKRIKAKELLSSWQILLHDFLLFSYGHNNLIRHKNHLRDFEKQRYFWSIEKLLDLNKKVAVFLDYLNANVNPSLVLENFVVQLSPEF